MENKEEKYFIHKVWDETIIQGNKFTTFCNNYGVEFTRQEAIYKMAAAMYYENYDRKELPVAFTEQSKGTQRYWEKIAKAALNALLEGGK